MTNSQQRQLADLYKKRERALAIAVADGLLELVNQLLSHPNAVLKDLTHIRDALAAAKAAGWPALDLSHLDFE